MPFLAPTPRRICAILSASLLLGLGACANHPLDPEVVQADTPTRAEAVNEVGQPGVITLETQPNAFWTLDYDRGDPLPNVKVGPIQANGASVAQLLLMVTQRLNVGFMKDPGLDDKTISMDDPHPIDLKTFLDIICRRAGLFYEYRDGVLSFESTRKFIVRVPRLEGSLLTISDAFRNAGATDVFVDPITGTITMSADYRAYKESQDFLRSFEEGRDMLVYDIWVFERTLTRGEGIGVAWDKLAARVGASQVGFPALNSSSSTTSGSSDSSNSSSGTSAASSAITGGLQFGIISSASSNIMNAFIQAMGTDSKVETVARPNLTMMSGGSADFQVGDKQQYISQVTNTVNSGLNGGSTQGVTPDTLETGIKLVVSGAYNDGIINTKLDLNINDLVSFDVYSTGGDQSNTAGNTGSSGSNGGMLSGLLGGNTTANGDTNNNNNNSTTLRLPHTTNRTMHTVVDARPGDMIVLGGLIRTNLTDAQQRIYHTSVPLSTNTQIQRTETIIFMRPRLVRIRPKGTPAIAADEVRVAPGVGRNVRTETGPLIIQADPMAVERAAHDLSPAPAAPMPVPYGNRSGIFDPDSPDLLPPGPPVARSPRITYPKASVEVETQSQPYVPPAEPVPDFMSRPTLTPKTMTAPLADPAAAPSPTVNNKQAP